MAAAMRSILGASTDSLWNLIQDHLAKSTSKSTAATDFAEGGGGIAIEVGELLNREEERRWVER